MKKLTGSFLQMPSPHPRVWEVMFLGRPKVNEDAARFKSHDADRVW